MKRAKRARRRRTAPAAVREYETALRWLKRRAARGDRTLLGEPQFAAGERLAADFRRAQLLPRVTANWSAAAPSVRAPRAAPGAGVEMSEAAVAARQRFYAALDAVGPELAGILVDVCCFDTGLEATGRAACWPRGAALIVLDLALARLARHYGLLPPERPTAGRLRHWGDADYRPTIEGWR
jgi:Domain of unknown function (DUF6456)